MNARLCVMSSEEKSEGRIPWWRMPGHGKGKLIWDSLSCQKSGKCTKLCCFHLFEPWVELVELHQTLHFSPPPFFFTFPFLTSILALELSIKASVFSLQLCCRLVERVAASPWNLLNMQTVDFHPRTSDEKLWMDPSNLWFNKPSQWFWYEAEVWESLV